MTADDDLRDFINRGRAAQEAVDRFHRGRTPVTADDTRAQQLVTELTAHAPMELVLAPPTVFQMTALIQLALRHPGVGADTRATADRFLAAVRTYFADCPAALDLVQRGDDPREDRK